MRSADLFARATRVIPGGVNSPVRAFGSVGGSPVFAERAEGAHIWDADGRKYIDYIQSWGASLLGHADQEITAALRAAVERGTSFGLPTEQEVLLAEEICAAVPSIESVRLVSSGTEATMSAVRVARGYTGRDLIVKFEGCYHGHSDGLLAAAGSGVATLGLPGSEGVPESAVASTVVLPYNDAAAVEELFLRDGAKVAAVIVEPVAANMGVVPPEAGFLETLRRVTEAQGSLFIFDEVITGFRMGRGGAQDHYGVTPDLTTLGKVIGGGLPVGAFGGRADVMAVLAPEGGVYQAGTLSGNPLATAAGLAVLGRLDDALYVELEGRAELLERELPGAVEPLGLPMRVQRAGTLLGIFFSAKPVTGYRGAAEAAANGLYAAFFREMLARGVLLAPSPYEALFVSLAHGRDDLERTIDIAAAAAAAATRR